MFILTRTVSNWYWRCKAMYAVMKLRKAMNDGTFWDK